MLFELVSNDNMQGASSGWWTAACGIKAGAKSTLQLVH